MAKQTAAQKKKAATKAKAKLKATPNLPQSSTIPEGMRQLGGGYATTWTPEEIGDTLHGMVSSLPKELTLNKGTRKENTTRVMEVTDMDGTRWGLWESVVLSELFDDISELGDDGLETEIYIEFMGLGKKKGKNNPPKLFTVAIAE